MTYPTRGSSCLRVARVKTAVHKHALATASAAGLICRVFKPSFETVLARWSNQHVNAIMFMLLLAGLSVTAENSGFGADLVGAQAKSEISVDAFYAASPDAGAKLSPDGIFPRGRKLAYMGYSGDPARDLTNGFTVAGPVYGSQLPYLERCASNGWPVVAHIGIPLKFSNPKTAAELRHPSGMSRVRQEIQWKVLALRDHQEIVWWAVTPEELGPWRSAEMDYLKNVCEVIRANDPRHRPIYLYNPNNRDAKTLAPIARQVDVVAKGTYVNSSGHQRERAWVQWSVEQEIAAIHTAGRPGDIPLLNPELCKDPEPSEDGEIRTWVRHDIYLGLASGAKGVLIWSLFPRKEVRRTWSLWYDAYAKCGRELNGSRKLAQVFLFGERRSDLKIRQIEGESVVPVTLGGKVEAGTTSVAERAPRKIMVPAWTSAEYAYGHGRWLFLINSANTPGRFVISGWPPDSQAENAFTGSVISLPKAGKLPVNLAACGVYAVCFSNNNAAR